MQSCSARENEDKEMLLHYMRVSEWMYVRYGWPCPGNRKTKCRPGMTVAEYRSIDRDGIIICVEKMLRR
jgi:hypothetical protein